jgi:hypothetical protein
MAIDPQFLEALSLRIDVNSGEAAAVAPFVFASRKRLWRRQEGLAGRQGYGKPRTRAIDLAAAGKGAAALREACCASLARQRRAVRMRERIRAPAQNMGHYRLRDRCYPSCLSRSQQSGQ